MITVGFFRSKRKADQQPAPRTTKPHVVTVGAADLAEADRLLAAFEQAVGSKRDARVRGSVLALAEGGGAPTDLQALDLLRETGDAGLDRPWQWLAAVAREAERSGNHRLVGRVALFTVHFQASLAPRLQLADQMDMRLSGAPASAVAEICTVALIALPQLEPEALAVDVGTDKVTNEQLMRMCAQLVLRQAKALLTPEVEAQARAAAG